jgi:hypothetical protein
MHTQPIPDAHRRRAEPAPRLPGRASGVGPRHEAAFRRLIPELLDAPPPSLDVPPHALAGAARELAEVLDGAELRRRFAELDDEAARHPVARLRNLADALEWIEHRCGLAHRARRDGQPLGALEVLLWTEALELGRGLLEREYAAIRFTAIWVARGRVGLGPFKRLPVAARRHQREGARRSATSRRAGHGDRGR